MKTTALIRSLFSAAILVTGLQFCTGCNDKETVVDVESPVGDVEVERDKKDGDVDVDVDGK